MNEYKMAMKRAMNEYKGKKDYERLLRNFFELKQRYEQVRNSYVEIQIEHFRLNEKARHMRNALIVTSAAAIAATLLNLTEAVLHYCGIL